VDWAKRACMRPAVREGVPVEAWTTIEYNWTLEGGDSASQPPVRYFLKRDEPPTGSHIRRDHVIGGGLPFNKRYAELTAEEQDYLKSQYERMGPADEPPFPVDGLGPIYKALDIGQRKLRLGIEGPMTLFVDVNSKGRATSVSVHQSPDEELTRLAAAIVMLQAYKPALCDGAPCAMQFPLRVTFTRR
jgi:TonB family protein